jgi:hypothetical protein
LGIPGFGYDEAEKLQKSSKKQPQSRKFLQKSKEKQLKSWKKQEKSTILQAETLKKGCFCKLSSRIIKQYRCIFMVILSFNDEFS